MLAGSSAIKRGSSNGIAHHEPTGSEIADPQDVPSEETNGTIHESQQELDEDIPEGVRTEWTSKMVMYGSTQTHSLGAKVSQCGLRSMRVNLTFCMSWQAALILGMQWKALPVSSKDNYALTGAAVRAALEEDKKQGLIPFLLSAFSLPVRLTFRDVHYPTPTQSQQSQRPVPAPLTIWQT